MVHDCEAADRAAAQGRPYWRHMVRDGDQQPVSHLGRQDDGRGGWAGWVYAIDADTGVWKWRLKSNYPIVGAMTPTAGGLLFFGDVGGNFYALDAATGRSYGVRRSAARSAAGSSPIGRGGERKNRSDDRPYRRRLANRDRDRQDRGARPRRRSGRRGLHLELPVQELARAAGVKDGDRGEDRYRHRPRQRGTPGRDSKPCKRRRRRFRLHPSAGS